MLKMIKKLKVVLVLVVLYQVKRVVCFWWGLLRVVKL